MVKLDFQPKLFSTLKNYTKTDFTTDLMAGIIVGIVALPLAIAFGIASGVSPGKGYYHSDCCRIHHFVSWGKQGTDRRTNRCFYRYHLRYHPRIWHRRSDGCHDDGWCTPYIIRSIQAGDNH